MGLSQKRALLVSKFIKHNYSRRVVEVGCGRHSPVAFTLARHLEVTAIDILESETVDERIRVLYTKDDVMSPDLTLYQNSQLLYSLRPPLEIQCGILNVAQVVQADVLIMPLGDEIVEALSGFLRNYYGLALYHLQIDAALRQQER